MRGFAKDSELVFVLDCKNPQLFSVISNAIFLFGCIKLINFQNVHIGLFVLSKQTSSYYKNKFARFHILENQFR